MGIESRGKVSPEAASASSISRASACAARSATGSSFPFTSDASFVSRLTLCDTDADRSSRLRLHSSSNAAVFAAFRKTMASFVAFTSRRAFSCQASAEQSSARLFPVPVGDSMSAFCDLVSAVRIRDMVIF
jgi:hypothetical protein